MKLATNLAVALVLFATVASVGHAAERREFAEYKCAITPPGPSFEWLDHSTIPHGAAFLANGDKAKLVFLTFDNPQGEQIDERFVQGFEKGMAEGGDIVKDSGRQMTFCGVPCYEMRARVVRESMPVIIRVFAANGVIYQLQLLGTAVGGLEQSHLDRMFSAFEFVGTPELPTPKGGNNSASYKMGRLAGTCLLVALVLALLGKVFKKKQA
ncbi:MAG: hypothetical protein RBU25_19675 [Lentisphaeria bacterium]|nr:hypothetical protein [Lentisphaeria bacterium]